MPIHIQELTANVTAYQGDLPISDQQLNVIARAVERLLTERQRQAECSRAATAIRGSAEPPPPTARS
jgi:hypothetical protein